MRSSILQELFKAEYRVSISILLLRKAFPLKYVECNKIMKTDN